MAGTLGSMLLLAPGCGSTGAGVAGPAGPAGPPGQAAPSYTAGPGITITANTIAVASAVATANVVASGTVTAGLFAGDGSALTSLPAGQLTGTVSDARLSSNVPLLAAGRLPSSTLPAGVAMLANVPTLGGDNAYSGAAAFGGSVTFSSLLAPSSAGAPSGGPQGAAAAGRLSFDSASRTLQLHDGTTWRTLAFASAFGPRSVAGTGVAPGATLSLSGLGATPVVTVWARATSSAPFKDVTGSSSFPTAWDPAAGSVTVTNGSGTSLDVVLSVVGP
jgi:hypothetical protein